MSKSSVTPWTVACQASLSTGFPRQNTGVGCHFLLQRIIPTQGLKLRLLHCRQILYHLSLQLSYLLALPLGSGLMLTELFTAVTWWLCSVLQNNLSGNASIPSLAVTIQILRNKN